MPPLLSPPPPHPSTITPLPNQSGALLIEGSTLGSSGGASFSYGASAGALPLSHDGAGDGAARACDFWGGLREERGMSETGGQLGEFGGDDDDDSDGGGEDFGGGFGQDDGDGFDDPEGGGRERGQVREFLFGTVHASDKSSADRPSTDRCTDISSRS